MSVPELTSVPLPLGASDSAAPPRGDAAPHHDTAGRTKATWIGSAAILLWASLALLTTLTRAIPTFEALTITFGVGAVTVLIGFLVPDGPRGIAAALRLWPKRAWALSIGGIFVYHALYFVGFRLAPAGPVTIVNYLWPLMIVIFAGLIPGGTTRLGWPQLLGGLIGFGATALLVGGDIEWSETASLGYAAAFACATLWGLYSVLNNRIAAPGSAPMILVCAAIALLGAVSHVVTGETFVMPDPPAMLALALLGAGPVGAAFVVWDHATKRGNIAILGAMSYATPPLSMIVLVAAGAAPASARLAIATVMVVAGAILAAMPSRRR